MTGLKFNRLIVSVVSFMLIYTPMLAAQELALPSTDVIAPKVVHEPVEKAGPAGEPLVISATVSDEVGLKAVFLFYRPKGEKNYQQVLMKPMGGSSLYMATIPGLTTDTSSIEYYIQAEDLAGNTLLRGYSFSPLVVSFGPAESPPAEEQEQQIKSITQKEPSSSPNKWIWIGLGALALGAVAASSGGSSSGPVDVAGDEGLSATITTTDPTD